MVEEKLVVKMRKAYGERAAVAARLPTEVIERLDSIRLKTGRSRNELMYYALSLL